MSDRADSDPGRAGRRRVDAEARVENNQRMRVNDARFGDTIRATIGQSVKINRILLFGSRATGTAAADSDVDLLVVIDGHHAHEERVQLATRCRRAFAEQGIDADVLVVTPAEVTAYGDKRGSVIRGAVLEGVSV